VTYLLDTDTCIYIIRKRPQSVFKKLSAMEIEGVAISSLTVAEMFFGVEKSAYSEQNRIKLTEFLAPFAILAFDGKAAVVYGRIRAGLESRGKTIGAIDELVASQAIAEDLTLVSNNTREFSRIPALKLENWA